MVRGCAVPAPCRRGECEDGAPAAAGDVRSVVGINDNDEVDDEEDK